MDHPKQNDSIELDGDTTTARDPINRVGSLSATPRASVSHGTFSKPKKSTEEVSPVYRQRSHTRTDSYDPDKDEMYNICCCRKLDGKVLVLLTQFLIVFSLVGAYFIYSLLQYLNTNHNRKEYTLEDKVDAMPYPFVYLDFPYVNGCAVITDYEYNDTTDAFGYTLGPSNYSYYDNNTDMKSILESTSDKWNIIFNEFVGGYNYEQYLIIPPIDDEITVDSKDVLRVQMVCAYEYYYIYIAPRNGSNQTNGTWNMTDFYKDSWKLYYVVDSREQLFNYDELGNALHEFFFTADYAFSGYDLKLSK